MITELELFKKGREIIDWQPTPGAFQYSPNFQFGRHDKSAWAEKNIAVAGVGAMAEKEELFGKVLILTVIPETIVLFGFVIAYLILGLAKGG